MSIPVGMAHVSSVVLTAVEEFRLDGTPIARC